jgi:hypothetical protein
MGGRRLMPGMSRRKYIVNEKIRSAGDENGAGPPTIVRVGTQEIGVPNLLISSQSQIPMAAISERWKEPRMSTGA